MNRSKSIGLYWDQLWRQLNASGEPALWDVPPSEAVIEDHEVFLPIFDEGLPLLDVGCGSGLQTAFLASKYTKVVGVDASKKAIQASAQRCQQPNVSFEHINLLNTENISNLHNSIGDVNVYMRGVIHQIPLEDREDFVSGLKILMGKRGSIYLIETAENIEAYIQNISSQFSELPLALKRVLTSHFPPIGVSFDEIHDWFDTGQYQIVEVKETNLKTNIIAGDRRINLPAICALVKNKGN